MRKRIKPRSSTDGISSHDESVSSTSILKHTNADDPRDPITETDVAIATASPSPTDDSSDQLERSDSDEDNDEEDWDQRLVFCSLT